MAQNSTNTIQPKRTRAEINRENAKKSTGPKTAEGKAASSKNALKHGIYSKFACIPGEDPEKLDALREDLRAEHQPASLTEEILVDELAHHYWRIKRYRYLESHMWTTPGRDAQCDLCADTQRVVWMIGHGLAALYQRFEFCRPLFLQNSQDFTGNEEGSWLRSSNSGSAAARGCCAGLRANKPQGCFWLCSAKSGKCGTQLTRNLHPSQGRARFEPVPAHRYAENRRLK